MSIDMQRKKKSRYLQWLFELDRILRGEATRPLDIQQADIRIPILGIASVIVTLGIAYGFCMGVFALVRGFENRDYQTALLQTFASMCKVPMLFMLTLVVTFPSLYVFNALVGSQLKILPVLKLLIASLAVNLAVLASMGPILAFFSLSTPNYSFIVLLNVVVFSIAGMFGLVFLLQTLNRLTSVHRGQLPATEQQTTVNITNPANPIVGHRSGPLDHLDGLVLGRHVRKVFACWIVVFGLVGAQMGWVLRPFIGNPDQEFQWLRARDSNFFEAVWNTTTHFLIGS